MRYRVEGIYLGWCSMLVREFGLNLDIYRYVFMWENIEEEEECVYYKI